jgi:hypothetical protein
MVQSHFYRDPQLVRPFPPFRPSVPINVQNLFLARLMATLENIPSRVHASRPAVRKGVYSPTVNPSLPGTSAQASDDVECGNLPAPDEAPIDYSSSDPSQPQHLIIGINQVTRALEHQLQFSRRRITLCTSSQRVDQPDVPSSNMAIVFVCCADLDPPALVDHIPYLVAGCNSAKDIPQTIRLVPLPKGSEATISQTIGLRRAAVIGIDVRGSLRNFIPSLDYPRTFSTACIPFSCNISGPSGVCPGRWRSLALPLRCQECPAACTYPYQATPYDCSEKHESCEGTKVESKSSSQNEIARISAVSAPKASHDVDNRGSGHHLMWTSTHF